MISQYYGLKYTDLGILGSKFHINFAASSENLNLESWQASFRGILFTLKSSIKVSFPGSNILRLFTRYSACQLLLIFVCSFH